MDSFCDLTIDERYTVPFIVRVPNTVTGKFYRERSVKMGNISPEQLSVLGECCEFNVCSRTAE